MTQLVESSPSVQEAFGLIVISEQKGAWWCVPITLDLEQVQN